MKTLNQLQNEIRSGRKLDTVSSDTRTQRTWVEWADGSRDEVDAQTAHDIFVFAQQRSATPRANVTPADGTTEPGAGACSVAGCKCKKFIPGATATTCNTCGHVKSKHDAKSARVASLDWASLMRALTP